MSTSERKYITIAQALKDWWYKDAKTPAELKTLNPLQIKIGDEITIENPDLQNFKFKVALFDVYTRVIDGKEYSFVDYQLHDDVSEPETWVTFRVIPVEGEDPNIPPKLSMLLLFPHRQEEYDETLHKKFLPSGVLKIFEDGKEPEVYERCAGLRKPYVAVVTEYMGKEVADPEEITYWDFQRTLPDGQIQYYFVELDSAKMFKTYHARQVSGNDVNILSTEV